MRHTQQGWIRRRLSGQKDRRLSCETRPLKSKETSASVAKNINVELALEPEKQVVTSAGQGDVLSGMADTKSNTSGEFRVIRIANTFTLRDERLGPFEGFSKTRELSRVVTARGGTKKKVGWPESHLTGPHRVRTKPRGETAAIHQPANSEPSIWRMKPPSVKSLQQKGGNPCLSGGGTTGGKHGKPLLWFG